MRSTSLCSALLLAPVALLAAATAPEPDLNKTFKRREVQIPMRDGVKLYTDIYIPKKSRGQLPFLFTRTPYGSTDDKGRNGLLPHSYKDFVDEGYIFVFQDIRGRYKSEGQFVMFRPPRDKSDAKAIDESTDTYDSIAWLLEHIPNNNGRAGVLGISYGGWLTVMAMLDPHPALKAVSEQASPADQFLGDDFHHNGAFRLSYGLEYSAMMETGTTNFNFKFDRHDTFEWYAALGALANFNKNYGHEKIPTWNDFVAHPNYDEFWQKQAVTPYLDAPKVPNLNVAGWWDQEDFYGPMKIYETLEKKDTNHMNYVVAGPWNHGGWSRGEGRKLGDIDFDSDTAQYFREKVQAPWFAYWLKDKGPLKQPEALTFQTGSNRWESYGEWPPRSRTTDRPLYFQSAGMASFAKPGGDTGTNNEFDSYVSDPARPVPYRHRPISPTYPDGGWPAWLVEDQRFVHLRPDVLSWETDPLQQDVAVAGDIVAHLFASTSGTDCDWIVKLIDVYPEDYPKDAKMGGYQLMIADEVFRARFRDSFTHPKAVVPDEVTEYAIDLHTNNHAFLKGHRIMVQVQSTWFPVIDRNPQTFVENIYKATEADYKPATQRVYRSGRYASHVTLPVLK
ncbi:MAG TPA: CocE/NonD family hydrolase [Bryobacteraceae bacterium]|jgi:putative CocE/NonD family hydrolase|nr:CocE/NonD family hydrolase [Bryobacteraceae bacterium]